MTVPGDRPCIRVTAHQNDSDNEIEQLVSATRTVPPNVATVCIQGVDAACSAMPTPGSRVCRPWR